MGTPKISVIIPVYKVEPYLRQCLDSVADQSYRNLEVILVDDGSPDNCGAICDEYAARDGRFRVIHKENGGVSSARNAGLATVTGDWIGWVDPDDWIEPDMFEYLLSGAQESGADIAVCSHWEVGTGSPCFFGWKEKQLLHTEEALGCLLEDRQMKSHLWDKLYRRELFEGVVFPDKRTYEDFAVLPRLFLKARSLICLPEAKYYYRQRQGGITDDRSLSNRIQFYQAAKERYAEICPDWPQFEPLLLSQRAASTIPMWTGYLSNKKEERSRYREDMLEIAAFMAEYQNTGLKTMNLGLAGRLVLRLTAHPKGWAYALAGLIGQIYRLKRGKAL